MKKRGKLTLKNLEPVLEDYEKFLGTWSRFGKDTLYRVEGSILQNLWLDRLRTGEYRPTFSIRVLTAPSSIGSSELCQFLNIKYQSISLSSHARNFDEICQAIGREIFPRVNESLNPKKVFKEYEKRAVPKLYESYSLASLSAFLGFDRKAKNHICNFRKLAENFLDNSNPVYSEYHEFINSLEVWIKSGEAVTKLNEIIQKETCKFS